MRRASSVSTADSLTVRMSGALTHRHSFQTCGNPDQVAAIPGQVGRQPQRVSKTMSRNGRIQAGIMETPVSISTSISTVATEAPPNGTTQKQTDHRGRGAAGWNRQL